MTHSASDFLNDPLGSQRVIDILAGFHSFEPGAHDQAVMALKALDRESVIRVLAGLLNHPDPDLRCDAAEALLRIDPNQTVDLVLQLLTDPSRIVRWYVCDMLHDVGDERAIEPLIKVLLEDPEGKVRLSAAWALGEIGNRGALPALHQAAKSDDGTDGDGRRVRDAAAGAVSSILARQPGEKGESKG